jgi:hypothetical protein
LTVLEVEVITGLPCQVVDGRGCLTVCFSRRAPTADEADKSLDYCAGQVRGRLQAVLGRSSEPVERLRFSTITPNHSTDL